VIEIITIITTNIINIVIQVTQEKMKINIRTIIITERTNIIIIKELN